MKTVFNILFTLRVSCYCVLKVTKREGGGGGGSVPPCYNDSIFKTKYIVLLC